MYNLCGINTKTDKTIMDPIPTSIEDNDELTNLGTLFMRLNLYTMYRDQFFLPIWYKEMFKNIKFNKETGINHYKDDNYEFDFYLFSDQIESFNMMRNLKSKKRFHKCHEASLGIALNGEDENTYILTGYVPTIDEEILHSVVELEYDSEIYIVDYTQNIMMKKEDFIRLNNFRLITRIPSSKVREDMDVMTRINIELPYYLVFRDEIVRDLKKNSKVLKLQD